MKKIILVLFISMLFLGTSFVGASVVNSKDATARSTMKDILPLPDMGEGDPFWLAFIIVTLRYIFNGGEPFFPR